MEYLGVRDKAASAKDSNLLLVNSFPIQELMIWLLNPWLVSGPKCSYSYPSSRFSPLILFKSSLSPPPPRAPSRPLPPLRSSWLLESCATKRDRPGIQPDPDTVKTFPRRSPGGARREQERPGVERGWSGQCPLLVPSSRTHSEQTPQKYKLVYHSQPVRWF